jgi:pyrroloquinoline-quinone synthase
MSDTLAVRLQSTLEGLKLLTHPFYRRWSMGQVSREELRAYAAQYRHFERALPGWLSRIAENAPSAEFAEQVRENLRDEAGGAIPHAELFEQFAGALDSPETAPSPAMAKLLETYARASQKATHGFAALWAYEAQASDVAFEKARGLREHYALDDRACEFWDVHAAVDSHHARWATEALEREGDASVIDSARAAAAAWWAFLDERQQHAA